jgi:hypothetical protein
VGLSVKTQRYALGLRADSWLMSLRFSVYRKIRSAVSSKDSAIAPKACLEELMKVFLCSKIFL